MINKDRGNMASTKEDVVDLLKELDILLSEKIEDSGDDSGDGHSLNIEIDLSDNIPVLDSPVYPSAIIGDSATPLQGQFHESEYKDDNYVGNTWKALINSYYS